MLFDILKFKAYSRLFYKCYKCYDCYGKWCAETAKYQSLKVVGFEKCKSIYVNVRIK